MGFRNLVYDKFEPEKERLREALHANYYEKSAFQFAFRQFRMVSIFLSAQLSILLSFST